MKQKKIKLSVLVLGIGITAQAQVSTNTSGGVATGSGGTVTYSVGQVFYTSNSSANGSVNQGVQQSYQISSIGIKETELNISLSVSPNPTAENLTLQINGYNDEKLVYQLVDIQGKSISKGEVNGQQTQIITSSLPSETYFINIVNKENKKVQSFKIIKN